jgi:hypothetical protein
MRQFLGVIWGQIKIEVTNMFLKMAF